MARNARSASTALVCEMSSASKQFWTSISFTATDAASSPSMLCARLRDRSGAGHPPATAPVSASRRIRKLSVSSPHAVRPMVVTEDPPRAAAKVSMPSRRWYRAAIASST